MSMHTDLDAVADIIGRKTKPHTKRSYRTDSNTFRDFCTKNGFKALPADPNTILMFWTFRLREGYAPNSILRTSGTIRRDHITAGLPSPLNDPRIKKFRKRLYELKNPTKKHPLAAAELDAMVERANTDGSLKGKHDRALMLIGWGPLKRSKLVMLAVADLKTLTLGPITRVAVQEWLAASGISKGLIFRRFRRGDHLQSGQLSPSNVPKILKRWAIAAELSGLDLGGESLRSGYRKHCATAGLL
jgi:hypothetical protein